ncbi:MAG TPA: hypothetical protein VFI31_11395 [Pirellulales bacterium]|nr:hypothetical protein [Pirellulales bacterium]
MPLIYRVMTRDGDKPKVGPTARTLGVRVPPDPSPDIRPKSEGTVEPFIGGMSVAPDIYRLPVHRVPRRYSAYVPKAHGKEQDTCWRWGDGPFLAGNLSAGLSLRLDRPGHGLVEPAYRMPVSQFQLALEATQDGWTLVEP